MMSKICFTMASSGGRAGDEAREIKHSQTGKDVIAVSHLIVSLTLPLLFAGH
jgi:hypothetical protein